jgi:arsenate reductase
MASAVKLYHNPRCSKSRQVLQLIESKGINIDVIEYIKQPPSYRELEQLLELLGLEPRQLMRTSEKLYKENKLDDPSLSREDLIEAMTEHPKLIERPIVIHQGKAVIGRPPEKILEII